MTDQPTPIDVDAMYQRLNNMSNKINQESVAIADMRQKIDQTAASLEEWKRRHSEERLVALDDGLYLVMAGRVIDRIIRSNTVTRFYVRGVQINLAATYLNAVIQACQDDPSLLDDNP